MKSYIDIAMGLLYIFISIYMLQMPVLSERFGHTFLYIFAGLFIVYGLYRGARGILSIFKSMKRE